MKKVSPEKEVPKHRAGKKNTRKWCLGKVGRSHEPVWVVSHRDHSTLYKHIYKALEFTCQNCGKVLDTWWAWEMESNNFDKDRNGRKQPEIGSREPLKKEEAEFHLQRMSALEKARQNILKSGEENKKLREELGLDQNENKTDS